MYLKTPEIASISTGYQSRKAVEYEPLGTHFLLQIRDFNPDRTQIATEGMVRFNPNPSSKDEPLRSEDVVFLSRGQKNFAFALPKIPDHCLAGSYFFVLRPKRMITGPYLAWYLNQSAAQHHFKRLASTGAHMPVVSRNVIANLKIPVPNLETQRKIIEIHTLAATHTKLLAELAMKKQILADALCVHAATTES